MGHLTVIFLTIHQMCLCVWRVTLGNKYLVQLLQLGSTYVCKTFLSAVAQIKTKQRAQRNRLLPVSLKKEKKSSLKHKKKMFLLILSMLSPPFCKAYTMPTIAWLQYTVYDLITLEKGFGSSTSPVSTSPLHHSAASALAVTLTGSREYDYLPCP